MKVLSKGKRPAPENIAAALKLVQSYRGKRCLETMTPEQRTLRASKAGLRRWGLTFRLILFPGMTYLCATELGRAAWLHYCHFAALLALGHPFLITY